MKRKITIKNQSYFYEHNSEIIESGLRILKQMATCSLVDHDRQNEMLRVAMMFCVCYTSVYDGDSHGSFYISLGLFEIFYTWDESMSLKDSGWQSKL